MIFLQTSEKFLLIRVISLVSCTECLLLFVSGDLLNVEDEIILLV